MRVLVGDCREVLKEIPDCSVDSVVCDPPYELGFMGKSWDSTGVAYDVSLWGEVLRVLKPGGHLLAFGGSRTYHRLACAVEDAGFEIRDQIMWVYGSGFPKSLNIGKQDGCEDWVGWGTALKPAHEPIVVARKPLVGTVAANVLEWGVGGLNIDGCRVGTNDEFGGGAKGTSGFASGYEHDGWVAGSALGRWPANLIHDGSDEVLELFPETSAGARPAKANKPTGEHYEGGWGPISDGERVEFSGGSAARFFYCAKAGKKERNAGLDHMEAKLLTGRDPGQDAMAVPHKTRTKTTANHHPTVKPIALMRYLVRLVTPPNGTVLDPFTGSGTTGIAAVLEEFRFVGIEQNEEYARIAEARIQFAVDDSR